MKYLIFSWLFWLGLVEAMAQKQEPIFRDKTDSIEYYELFDKITELYESVESGNKKQRDSMTAVITYWIRKQERLRDKIIGHRWVYLPSHKLIADIRPQERDAVTALTLTNLAQLPPELFLFKNLQTLELIDCRLPTLPRKLRDLKNLTQLSIYTDRSGKRLKLPKKTNIKKLIISSRYLPKNFRSLKKLHRLDLSKNNLTAFPNIRGCKKLRELSLRENQLTLGKLSTSSKKLEVLELQKNQIKEVPASIARFPYLKRLVLNHNQIKRVDEKLAVLTKLEHISFYSNELSAVPIVLYEITSLKEIDLYYNQIERLGTKASNWKKLEVLYLSNNKLISLPENIGDLVTLRELYLHNNRLSELPKSITQLSQLEVLRVNSNFLLDLPNIAVLDKLENIDLSNNYLQTFPLDVFRFPNLKIISVLGNEWDNATRKEIKKYADELEKKEVSVIFN